MSVLDGHIFGTAFCKLFVRPNNPFVLWFPMIRTDVFSGVASVTRVSSGLSMPMCNQDTLCFSHRPTSSYHPFHLGARDIFILLASLDTALGYLRMQSQLRECPDHISLRVCMPVGSCLECCMMQEDLEHCG